MSEPSSSSRQNPSFSQGANANSPAQFNLAFPPTQQQAPNNVGINNGNGSAGPSMPPGVNPQFLFQNGNLSQPPPGMNGNQVGVNGNGQPFDQAALQARIALAQQMAQAGMQQHNQQEQRANGGGQGGSADGGLERRTSGTGPQPGQGGSGDWTQLANAANAGMMQNVQATTREALMKQLQALQSSHAAATRNRLGSGSGLGQSPPAPSPGLTNNSHPSPIPHQSPSHLDTQIGQSPASVVNPTSFRAQSVDATQQRPGSSGGPPLPPPQPSTPSSSTAPGPPMRSTSGPQMPTQVDSPVGQNAPTPTSGPGGPIRPPGAVAPGARPGMPVADQRRQFLQSLVNWHKSHNIPPPPEIFNAERSGAIKMGETWVEVVELFLTVLRVGGIDRVTKLPPDSPFWQAFFKAKGIPNPLPRPIQLPSSPKAPDQVLETTTDPVRFLIRAYMVWLYGFEQHMNTSKMALAQRQAKMGSTVRPPAPQSAPSPAPSQAPIDTASTPQANAPSPAVATPVMTSVPTPTQPSAPTPTAYPPTPQPQTPSNPAPPTPYTQAPPMPPQNMPTPPQQFAPPYSQAQPQASSSTLPDTRQVPPPIKVDDAPPVPGSHAGTPTTARGAGAKRGRKRKDANGSAPGSGSRSAATSRSGTPAATSAAPPPSAPAPAVVETPAERPNTSKRARYKVEYRPLHLPQNHLAGWDDRAVASTFPKNNVGHPSRSIHELGVVDMEAILMGLRSRLPGELGYALTVLSMLSMGSPEEHILGLPLSAIFEIYVELLELLSEAAFGEDGYEAWSTTAPKQSELNDMTFGELERLGRDFDFSLDERKDTTGGQTDIVLTCLNLLRNFSILPENCQLMTQHPEIFELLAHLSDGRLCRLPTSIRPTEEDESTTVHHQPFSLYEFARVRRDVVTVLSNLGSSIDLRRSSASSIHQITTVISSFLSSGWSSQVTKDSLYGHQAHPPSHYSQHSVNRAVEAFCKLSWSDANREVLSKLPAEQLVLLFESMIQLLPVQRRQFELLYSSEEYLCQTECLALSLYSLAFLAPLPTRTVLRNLPGRIGVVTRIIFDLSRRGTDFRSNPYAVLVRRLAETLGILNGTNGLESDDSLLGLAFGAGVGIGAGQTSGSRKKVVERGWLAEHEEKVMESMAVRNIDVPAFIELDSLWWAGGD